MKRASLLVIVLASCAHRERGAANVAHVVVDRSERAQTMDGLGWNAGAFVWANDLGHDAKKELAVLDDAKPRFVRLAGWLTWFQSERGKIMSEHETPKTHDLVAAKDLTSRGIEVDVGIWDLPGWLVDGRTAKHDSLRDAGELIASYVKFLVDGGATVSAVQVQNEPAIAALTKYSTPEDLVVAGHALVDAPDSRGLHDVKLYAPDADRPSRTIAWAEPWFGDDVLRERTAAVSFHTWWDRDENSYRDIARLAAKYRKPVWATEDGACADEKHDCSAGSAFVPSTWETAHDTAMSVWRAIAWARATRVYHWSLVGNGAAIEAATGKRTATYDVFAGLAEAARPGSAVVDVDARAFAHDVRALAFDSGNAVDVVLIEEVGGVDGPDAQRVDFAVPGCTLASAAQLTSFERPSRAPMTVVDGTVVLRAGGVVTAHFNCDSTQSGTAPPPRRE
jgi:O-glycosyl hydrolase